MKTLVLIIVFLTLCPFAASAQTKPSKTPQTPKEFSEQGVRQLNSGAYSAAIISFTACINMVPLSWSCYHNRGVAYFKQKQYRTAIEDLTRAINNDGSRWESYSLRASIYATFFSDLDRALADVTKVISIDPNLPEEWSNRAQIFVRKKDYASALADYNKAIELGPRNGGMYLRRMKVHCALGKTDLAELDHQQAAKFGYKVASICTDNDEQKAEAQRTKKLAEVQKLKKQLYFDEALEILDSLIKADPNYVAAYRERAEIYADEKKFDLARADIQKILSIEPNNAWARDNDVRLAVLSGLRLGEPTKPVNSKPTAGKLFEEEFVDNKNGWAVGKNENSELAIRNGIYSIETKSAGANTVWLPMSKALKLDPAKDFTIKAKFKIISGGAHNAVGLIWGITKGRDGYEFAVYPDSRYFYGKRVDGQNAAAARPIAQPNMVKGIGSMNELKVTKTGNAIWTYINGIWAQRVNFETFDQPSTIGFVIYGAAKIEFDALSVEQD